MFEDLLHKFGVDKNTLTTAELETLNGWQQALAKNELSVPSIATYIDGMIAGIEKELFDYENPAGIVALLFRRKRRRNLEARLLNYILLRDFLRAPEKARRFVEAQLKNLSTGSRLNG